MGNEKSPGSWKGESKNVHEVEASGAAQPTRHITPATSSARWRGRSELDALRCAATGQASFLLGIPDLEFKMFVWSGHGGIKYSSERAGQNDYVGSSSTMKANHFTVSAQVEKGSGVACGESHSRCEGSSDSVLKSRRA